MTALQRQLAQLRLTLAQRIQTGSRARALGSLYAEIRRIERHIRRGAP